MSLPILIKPLSLDWGFFYYFRFALNRLKYIVVSFLFFCFCFEFTAQSIDSLRTINFKYDSILKSEDFGMDRLFYKHDDDVLIKNLGPFGSRFYYPTAEFLYNNSILNEDDVIFSEYRKLNGVKPFTNLTYVNASRKEQIFKIKHIQSFGKQLSFSFDLIKVSSPGAFVNQEANNSLFSVELGYHTKKNNYEVIFSNEIQRDFYQENGGLADPDDYENKLFDDARNYTVNLSSSNSYVKRYRYNLFQRLDLMDLSKDSLFTKKIYLSYNASYETYRRVFFDNDQTSEIYQSNYLDSAGIFSLLGKDSLTTADDTTSYNYLTSISNRPTIDSLHRKTFSNEFNLGYRNQHYSLEILYQYDMKNYYQGFEIDTVLINFDTNYTNTYAGVKAMLDWKGYSGEGLLKYGLSGYRQGDVLAEVRVNKRSQNYNILLGGGYFLTAPDLKYVNYISNHFNWKNPDLKKQSVFNTKAKLGLNKFRLELSAENKLINNALYYDSLSIASQNDESMTLTSFKIAKDYSLWKFHFRTAGIYQIASNKFITPIPAVIVRHIMYYEGRVFKKALKLQFGVGGSYSTDYFGYGYSPAISEFTVQENYVIGYYPNIDIFLNTYLKRAQIFLKWEHFNAGRSNYKSFLAPNYPRLSRSLKFGISWNLFD